MYRPSHSELWNHKEVIDGFIPSTVQVVKDNLLVKSMPLKVLAQHSDIVQNQVQNR